MNTRATQTLIALTSLGLLACTGGEPKPDPTPAVEAPTEAPTEGATSEKGITKDAAGEKRADPSSETAKADETKAAAIQVWIGLGVTSNSCENVFDYWPNGGLLITACHLVSVSNPTGGNLQLGAFEALARLSPVPVFLSGPHQDGFLLGEEASLDNFGHYNPAFVDWFVANAVPGADDDQLRGLTKRYYDKNLSEVADTFEAVYQAAKSNEECFERERGFYLGAINSGDSEDFHFSWYEFFSPTFCNNPESSGWGDMNDKYDGNVVQSAVGFWIRRSIDGTMEKWHDGLVKLRTTYAD